MVNLALLSYLDQTQQIRNSYLGQNLQFFVAMESETRLMRVFVPSKMSIRAVLQVDFHLTSTCKLSSLLYLRDGLSRKANVETEQETEDGIAEEHLINATASIARETHPGISDGPPLPVSFDDTCSNSNWPAAIDREYNALVHRNTWKYVKITNNMLPILLKWTFRAKQIDDTQNNFLYKARCVL